MEINASCTYDLKALRAIRTSTLTKGRIAFHCIAAAIILAGIVVITVLDSFPFWLAGLCLLCAVYLLYLFRWSANIAYNKMGDRRDCVVSYIFREVGFHVSVQTKTMTEDAELLYSGLYRAREGQRYIYLYPTKRGAYTVDKSTMAPGHAAIVSDWLKNALGKNYKQTSTK